MTSLSPHRQGYYINENWNIAKQSLYHKMSMCAGKVYAVGGHDGNEHLGSMEVFDPLTNKWMMKASMNTKRYMCPTLQILVCDVPFLADAEKYPAFFGSFETVLFLGFFSPILERYAINVLPFSSFFFLEKLASLSRAVLLCPVNNLELISCFCGFFALFKNEQNNCQHNIKSEILHSKNKKGKSENK